MPSMNKAAIIVAVSMLLSRVLGIRLKRTLSILPS